MKIIRCNICGTTDRRILVIHHKNRNHNDNLKRNLEILCHNCHFLVHHYSNFENKILKIEPLNLHRKFLPFEEELSNTLGMFKFRKNNVLYFENGTLSIPKERLEEFFKFERKLDAFCSDYENQIKNWLFYDIERGLNK